MKSRDFDIFLSYKSEDHSWVRTLKEDLVRRGVRVWLDADQIRPGDLFAKALEEGIGTSSAVGLVVTPESIASGWVREEYYRALSLATKGELQLIPILLRKTEMPGFLEGRQYVDVTNPAKYDRAVDKLVWPGITGRSVVFVSVHPGHRVRWPQLSEGVRNLGLQFVGAEDITRAELYNLAGIMSAKPPLRTVVVVDIFEARREGIYESKVDFRRNSPEEYVDFIFSVRERTRNAPDEPIFLLYHHSEAWAGVTDSVSAPKLQRLRHYFAIHQDLPRIDLQSVLRDNWYRIQRELLRGAYRRHDEKTA